MKIVFREKCQVDKYEMVSRVIDHAEFEYAHENCIKFKLSFSSEK